MELLYNLPDDLNWNVIKYSQHPLTMIFNRHIEVTEANDNGTHIFIDFIESIPLKIVLNKLAYFFH